MPPAEWMALDGPPPAGASNSHLFDQVHRTDCRQEMPAVQVADDYKEAARRQNGCPVHIADVVDAAAGDV